MTDVVASSLHFELLSGHMTVSVGRVHWEKNHWDAVIERVDIIELFLKKGEFVLP